MSATCFLRDIVGNKGYHQVVWFSMMSYFAVADFQEVIPLKGHVGGEVAFRCPVEPNMKYTILYLQRGSNFVNGYYESKDINKYHPWPNSRVDKEQNVIYMSRLNISHAGLYTCLFQNNEDLKMKEANIKLTMTANYSKPSMHLQNCTDKTDQCLVLCSSHGGYPKSKMIWNVTALEWDAPPSDSFTEDNDTQLFNISSMASFNCSTGKQQNISCSVDGLSTVLSICEQESASEESHERVIIIIIAAVIVVICALLCFFCRNKIRHECCGANAANTPSYSFQEVQQESGV